ncbi:MFS transporter [Halobacterium wangiae]|uniref:MFS transporter n=1 Tax=Halobacterium wangiae TaxID=2902623 RepID=UPI001E4AC6C6|nr:MFS transporter [Halobacterium wangiae]
MLSRERLPPRIILKYYLYQATATFGFFWPVFTIFLLDRGLNYTQIGLLGSISAAFVVVGEVPTGYAGDRIGRRNSLLVGSVLLALSVLGFLVAETFLAFAVLWVLWALGLAFRSGSGDAWLYETLEERLDEGEFTRVRGRGGSVNQWLSAATMLAAGALYSYDPRLPFLAGGLLLASSIPVLLSMPETNHQQDGETFTVLDAPPVLREQLTNPPLRSTVLYLALFFGIVNAADEFIQPIATGPAGLSETALGPLYAGFTVLAAVTSYFAGDVEELLSTQWALVLVPGLVGAFFVVPLLLPVAALPVFFLMKSARTAVAPIASGYVNDHAGAAGRATVLSAASMVYALARLPLKPLAGAVADATTPLVAIAGLGGCFLVAGSLVFAWERPGSDAAVGDGQPAD